jgi:uncharacterized repeat protein (TIGR03803 family)
LAQFDYGIYPRTLAAASDGNLYGTTQYGGSSGRGEAFQVTTNGGFAVLYSFRCDSVGQYPSDLMQASSRLLFGSTSVCGTNGDGTVFRASVFAPPPILLSNPVLNGTQFSFEWNAITGKVYSVEWGSNLTAWFNLNSFVVATGSTMRITSPAFDPQRFFRVGLHP